MLNAARGNLTWTRGLGNPHMLLRPDISTFANPGVKNGGSNANPGVNNGGSNLEQGFCTQKKAYISTCHGRMDKNVFPGCVGNLSKSCARTPV